MALAALGGLAGIPPEVTDAIQAVTEKFTNFLKEFSKAYIVAFVQDKLEKLMAEAAGAAFGGVPDLAEGMFGDDEDDGGDEDADEGGDDAGAEDGGEEKGGDDENKATDDNGGNDEEVPLAAGISLLGVRLEEGLDYAQHRYYDIAAVAIRPKGSLIRRVTKTHRKLLNGSSELLEAKEAPEGLQFPQKKWGKKDEGFYHSRFEAMQEFYDAISNSPVALQPPFLKQFDLLADPKREHRMKMFVEALGDVCKKYSKENDIEIDMGQIMERAASLGVEADEQELLKVVGIKAIAGPVIEMIKEAAGPSIKDQAPGFMEKMKHGTIKKSGRKAIKSMTVTISGIVRGSYAALGPILEKVGEGVQAALDKTIDPIIKVIRVLAKPLGKGVKERFGVVADEEAAEEPEAGGDEEAATEENAEEKEAPEASGAKQSLKRQIEIDRYPWMLQLFNTVESGSSSKNALQTLSTQIDAFRRKEDFAGYLVYDFGIAGEMNIPFVEAVQEPHEAIVDAVMEVWIVLSQAGTKAMMPLFELHDEVSKEFDPSTFEAKKRNAIRLGGQVLAKEYFELPKNLRRALKRHGPKISRAVTKLAQKTVNLMADSLGVICRDWNPTIPPEVTPLFIEVTKKQAQIFGQKTATRVLTTIQVTTQLAFVNVVMGEMGPVVDEATGAVDEVLSLLPEPIPEYFAVSGYCKKLLDKMIYKACFMAVARMAKPSHDTFFTGGRVRQTILHVEVSAGAIVSSPRMSMAQQAAEDDENNTTDEEREDEELSKELAEEYNSVGQGGEGDAAEE